MHGGRRMADALLSKAGPLYDEVVTQLSQDLSVVH